MKRRTATLMLCAVLVALVPARLHADAIPPEYQAALDVLGKPGDYKDSVLRVSLPRTDLHVSIDGIPVPTAFGFGGWLAMTKGDGGMDMMMGDLPLLEDEVNPIMSLLLDNKLEVTALHNHFLFERPRVFFMHVHGMGTPKDLAAQVRPALDLLASDMKRNEQRYEQHPETPAITAEPLGAGPLDTAGLARIIGHKGENLGPVYKITIGRDDMSYREMGARISSRMGLNTWAAFLGSDGDAIIAGDIAMREGEVEGVLRALRANGLSVVAIHNHMFGAQPFVIFLHYWGRGRAEKLATSLKAALDQLGRPPAAAGATPMKME
jgi:hypothetical protein